MVKKNKVKNFLCIFKLVYGDSKKFPLKESVISPKNIYAFTKKNNEEIVELFFKNSITRTVGLRFFTVYGEWGDPIC